MPRIYLLISSKKLRNWQSVGLVHGAVVLQQPHSMLALRKFSKQTESGESLGRGAFVVRGQRTWYRDVDMEIAIGFATVNNIPIPISGTVEGVSKLCQRWAIIRPDY